MKNIITFGHYTMRLIERLDVDAYYQQGFKEASQEAQYFTGTVNTYTKEQVESYVNSIVENPSRFDFLIFEHDHLIGEIVLMDVANGVGHYRVCIFNRQNFSKGIGYLATEALLTFAFEDIKLEWVELEVFPFNTRGIALYQKLGFKLVDQIEDNEAEEPYRRVNVMRLSKAEYNANPG